MVNAIQLFKLIVSIGLLNMAQWLIKLSNFFSRTIIDSESLEQRNLNTALDFIMEKMSNDQAFCEHVTDKILSHGIDHLKQVTEKNEVANE